MMPTTSQEIEMRLSDIRLRHSGKAPFGPLDDLEEWYAATSELDRPLFLHHLKQLKDDSFWGFFIASFKKAHPGVLE